MILSKVEALHAGPAALMRDGAHWINDKRVYELEPRSGVCSAE